VETRYRGYVRLCITGWKTAVFGREFGDDSEYTKACANPTTSPRLRIRLENLADVHKGECGPRQFNQAVSESLWSAIR
jgi:hypothetical protein